MDLAYIQIQYWIRNDNEEEMLNLNSLNLTFLPVLPRNLKVLSCRNNQLTNLNNLPENLKVLNCSNNLLTNLNNLPENLNVLDCSFNRLSILNNLPITLKILYCNNNIIPIISNLPRSLINLNCSFNNLTNLENLPNLKTLDCRVNNLEYLPILPYTLTELNCTFNNITKLPHLPVSLISINFNNNVSLTQTQFEFISNIDYEIYNNNDDIISIRSINIIPDENNNNIIDQTINEWIQNNDTNINLNLRNLNINSLPVLPNNLKKLNINTNNIKILNNFSENLQQLICDNNYLTEIINLPNTLLLLSCNFNLLSTLPVLPNNLRVLHCRKNKLTKLPILPTTLTSISFDNTVVLTQTQYNFINNIEHVIYNSEGYIVNINTLTIEETSEELQNRVDIANTSLQNIHLQNINNANNFNLDIESDDIPLYLQELDAKESEVYKQRCNNTEDLFGDNLNVKYGNIVILDISNENKYIAWCFTYSEALEMWKFSKTYNILSYTGQIINQRGILLSMIYNTFVLQNTNTTTSNYVGHHDIKTIYTLQPIPRNVFIQHIKINDNTINNFVPSINDLNLYYLNNPYTQPNNNNPIITKNIIKCELGQIQINPLKSTVRIIKDNEVGDINKSYSIIGNDIIKN